MAQSDSHSVRRLSVHEEPVFRTDEPVAVKGPVQTNGLTKMASLSKRPPPVSGREFQSEDIPSQITQRLDSAFACTSGPGQRTAGGDRTSDHLP